MTKSKRRKGHTDTTTVPRGITHLFLLGNVVAMTVCSTMILARKRSEYAVIGLIGVVVTQALGYGLIFDLNFFLRNLSVMGGLLMVLSDSWVRKKFAPAGLPQMDEKDRKMYFQLAGRILLIFLFIGFVFAGEWSFSRVMVILVGAVACVMVVVGFKAKWSAVILVAILSIFNILVNNFWTVRCNSRSCDGNDLLTHYSCTTRILKRTLPSTTSSRSSPSCKCTLRFTVKARLTHSVAVSFCWSTKAPANSAWTRRRRSTRMDKPSREATNLSTRGGSGQRQSISRGVRI